MAFNNNTDGTLTIGTQVDTKGFKNGVSAITKQANILKASLENLIGIHTFATIGKQAIDAASELAEWRNVAVNTFKELTPMLDEFLQTTIETYGMSELTATTVASGYKAMANSAGLANKEAANMSIELTRLVGDMASFYNLSHERARTALAAVFTGETETMKQYGIMLQEVNLQQYENEKGLGRKVKTMSAAEKVQLRYNYIMDHMADAQGDFARTANQWANQVRVLQENWRTLLITMGNGFKQVLNPLIVRINQLIKKFIEFANVVGASLGKIFGLRYTKQVWVADDAVSGVADSMQDVADATEDAGKEAKKALAPFDDLNVLAEDTAKSSSDTGNNLSNLGDSLGGSGGHVEDIEIIPESDLDDLFKLGRYIADKLQDMLERIDWRKIYDGARNFGTGLAEFLNGLIKPELFYQLGRTIANTLNTVLYDALAFAETFDFHNFGLALAEGLNGLFENFDFTNLGRAIKKWVDGIFDAIVTFFKEVRWKTLLDGINKTLKQLDWTTVLKGITIYAVFHPKKIVTAITTALNKVGLITIMQNWLMRTWVKIAVILDNVFELASVAITAGFKKLLATKIVARALDSSVAYNVKHFASTLKTGLNTAETAIARFLGVGTSAVRQFEGYAVIIAGLALAVCSLFDVFKNGATPMNTACTIIGAALVGLGLAITTSLGPISILVAAIAGLAAVIVGNFVHDMQSGEDSVQGLSDKLVDLQEETDRAKDRMSEAASSMQRVLEDASASISTAGESEYAVASALLSKYEELASKSNLTAAEKEKLKFYSDELVKIYPELNQFIDSETGLLNNENGMLREQIELLKQKAIVEAYTQAYKDVLAEQIRMQGEYDEAVRRNKESIAEWKTAENDVERAVNLVNEALGAANSNMSTEELEYYRNALEELGMTSTDVDKVFKGYVDTGEDFIKSMNDRADAAHEASIKIQQDNHGIVQAWWDSSEQLTNIENGMNEQLEIYANKQTEIAKTGATETGEAVTEGLTEGLSEGQEQIKETMAQSGEEASNSFDEGYTAASESSTAVEDANASKFSSTDTTAATDAGTKQGKAEGEAVNKSAADSVASTQGTLNTQLQTSGTQAAQSFTTAFSEGLVGLSEAIISALPTSDQWVTAFATVTEQINVFIENTKLTITESFTTAFAEFTELFISSLETFNEETLVLYTGYDVWYQTFTEGPMTAYKTIWDEFTELWNTNTKTWQTESLDVLFGLELWTKYGKNMQDGIYAGFKGIVVKVSNILNSLIDGFNKAIQNIVTSINALITSFNEASAAMGGPAVSPINAPPGIAHVTIPALAKGAVIPPNKEFMAILGDQKHGTNIEAPLDTIVDAMKIALNGMNMGSGNQSVNLTLDGEVLARLLLPYSMGEMNRVGYDVSVLEGGV